MNLTMIEKEQNSGLSQQNFLGSIGVFLLVGSGMILSIEKISDRLMPISEAAKNFNAYVDERVAHWDKQGKTQPWTRSNQVNFCNGSGNFGKSK